MTGTANRSVRLPVFKQPRPVVPASVSVKPRTFSTNQVVEASGATPRQLQWWDEKHCVSPRYDGHSRSYSFEEAIECCIVEKLREAGDTLQKIRKVLPAIRTDNRIKIAVREHSELWLLIGKKQVNRFTTKHSGIRFAFSAAEVADEMRINDQYFLLIAVHDIVSRLELVR